MTTSDARSNTSAGLHQKSGKKRSMADFAVKPGFISGKVYTMRKLILWCGILFFIYNVFLQAIGSYEINYFDGAIQIAAQNYVAGGLVPFKDFSLIYSPGQYLLAGKIVPFKSVFISNLFYTALESLLVVYASVLILKVFQNYSGKYFVLATHLAVSGIILRVFGGSGSLPYILMEVIFLISLTPAKKALMLLSLAYVWLRWDWLLFFASGRWSSTKLPLLGYLIGLGTLTVYLLLNGTLKNAFLYMIYLPIVMQGSYRHLPLPPPTLPIHPNGLVYLAGAVFVVLIFRAIKTWSNENVRNFFPAALVFIVTFVPYALARSDWPHFLGVWAASSLVWVMIDVFIDGDHVNWLPKAVIPLFFLPLVGWYVKGVKSFNPKFNYAQVVLDRELAECKNKTENIKINSIFVGRVSYNRFLYNVASLYLLYPDVPPATPNLMEEPGIQNTCEFGEKIGQYLYTAKRPMLAFLEEGDHQPENELTRKMTSCGKIENYLSYADYEKIGQCESYGEIFDIRLYK